MTTTTRTDLYRQHAATNTVPQGSLRSDLAPRAVLRALHVVLAKRTLSRKRLPIRLDLREYLDPDFRYDTSSALDVERQLDEVPSGPRGVKWIHRPDGVYFHAVEVVAVPYDEFVDRVDISRVGDCFRDVLGINTRVLHRDGAGRPLLQVERIAALAQPNYAAFLGKDELDVYKLEWMQYGPDEQRNWMRTVCSPNGSTWADNGYLAFRREPGRNETRIVFVAHQAFPFPRVMELTGMNRWTWLRTRLTEAAYRRFWHETLANIMARHEGRPIGIGRSAHEEAAGRAGGLAVTLAALTGAVIGLLPGAMYLRSRSRHPRRRR